MVASLVQASWLFLLTDVDALYDRDPRKYSDAHAIRLVDDIDTVMHSTDSASAASPVVGGVVRPTLSGQWGTGGMETKITAARIAISAGVTVGIIHSANVTTHLTAMMNGVRTVGTTFLPSQRPIRGRKKFIAHGLTLGGRLIVDGGAVRAVHKKKSLFAAGITQCVGEFPAQSAVAICDASGVEHGRGLVNYSSSDVRKVMGVQSWDMNSKLGVTEDGDAQPEIIHRDSLVITHHSWKQHDTNTSTETQNTAEQHNGTVISHHKTINDIS